MTSATIDVGAWLRGLGLGEYEATFRENAIDDTPFVWFQGVKDQQTLVHDAVRFFAANYKDAGK
jgi:hypothetical protein